MSVSEPQVVDFIGLEGEGAEVVLTISERLAFKAFTFQYDGRLDVEITMTDIPVGGQLRAQPASLRSALVLFFPVAAGIAGCVTVSGGEPDTNRPATFGDACGANASVCASPFSCIENPNAGPSAP